MPTCPSIILDGSLEFSEEHLGFHFKKSTQYLDHQHPGGCTQISEHKEDAAMFKSILEERHTQYVPAAPQMLKIVSHFFNT